jgi:hypothetical protein
MSAYGAILRASRDTLLPSTVWQSVGKEDRPSRAITVHHLTLDSARRSSGLIEYLWTTFAQVVEDGMTYPQEGPINQAEFEAYFFSGDVFIGISPLPQGTSNDFIEPLTDGSLIDLNLDSARAERSWEQCVAGFYYVRHRLIRGKLDGRSNVCLSR